MGRGIMKKQIDSVLWQDYRASNTAMVVFYASDPISEIPIREIPEEIDSLIAPEPNYESRVFGFYGCVRPKIRSAFVKSKIRYLFFLTKYVGAKEEYKNKNIITGYYHIVKTADVQKLHLRYINDCACLDADSCVALRADDVRFVLLPDAFMVDDEKLKSWGYNAKVTKQLRIILDEEKTAEILEYLKSKPDRLAEYIKETKRLEPRDESAEQEETDEGEEAAEKAAEKAAPLQADKEPAQQNTQGPLTEPTEQPGAPPPPMNEKSQTQVGNAVVGEPTIQ